MFLVTYDIEDDRKRNKISKILEDYGSRVQYSVFQLAVERKVLFQVLERVAAVIDNSKDSIIFVPFYEDTVISLGTPKSRIGSSNKGSVIIGG